MIADCNVDDGGEQKTSPDGEVISEDAQLVELVVDPAP
jgi:hypothetical protein